MESEHMSEKRYRRHRNPNPKPINFSASPVYDRILYWAWKLSLVRVDDLAAMIQLDYLRGKLKRTKKQLEKNPSQTVNWRVINNNVRKLFDHGYLEKRVRDSVDKKGSFKHVYHLTEKGALRVAVNEDENVENMRYFNPPQKHKPHGGQSQTDMTFMFHHLLVTSTMVTFHINAYLLGYDVHYFATDRQVEIDFEEQVGGKRHYYSFIPDAFAIVGKGDKRENVFFEIDRNTQSQIRSKKKGGKKRRDIKDKLEAYYVFHISNVYREFLKALYARVYDLNPQWLDVANLPSSYINNMQVLFVTIGGERRMRGLFDTLLTLIAENRIEDLRKERGVGRNEGIFAVNTSKYFERYCERGENGEPKLTFNKTLEANKSWRKLNKAKGESRWRHVPLLIK